MFQAILVIFSLVLYGINIVYNLITLGISKDADRLFIESVVSTIINSIPSFYSAVCLFFSFVR
jgi:hypothetical protein